MNNLLKLIYLLSMMMAFNLSAFSQQQWGVKASGGISRIYGQLDFKHDPEFPMTTSFSPSFQAGIYWHFPMGRITSVGAELLYSKVQGSQTLQWSESYFKGTVSHIIYEDVSYLSLPIYVGLTFSKLTFNVGFQVSHAMASSWENKMLFLHDGKEGLLANPPSSNFPARDFDFGPRAGIIYQLNNRLSMEGIVYYGLSDISYSKSASTDLKIQQMTVGLRYALKHKQVEKNIPSQHQLGIKISGGLSRITNSANIESLTSQFVPSGQGGFYYNRTLGNESSLGMELLFSQTEGKEMSDVILIANEGFNMIYAKNTFYRHISYLSLPVYYGMNIKKLTIHGGFQLSYAITSSSLSKYSGKLNGQPYSSETKTDHINIDKFDFGPRAGIIYLLTDNLALEANYFYSLNNLVKDGTPAWKLKVQQVTLGVRYALWNNSKTQ